MGKLKETSATVLGFDIPNGGSKEAIKSESCAKWINCVAWGSYLKNVYVVHMFVVVVERKCLARDIEREQTGVERERERGIKERERERES